MAIIKLNATRGLENALPAISGAALTGVSAGKVLQVVHSTNSYQKSSASTSLQDMESSSGTVWETTITPSATSSKILVISHIMYYMEMSGQAQDVRAYFRMNLKIGSGSYSGQINNPYTGLYHYSANRVDFSNICQPFQILASPNTTDACKIKFDYKSLATSNFNLVINYGSTSTCTLMEIDGS
tara:strand:- start:510 stop:1061 length:552 start_codon:yes stop_codon:yes gene_type:complete